MTPATAARIAAAALLALASAHAGAAETHVTELHGVRVVTLAEGLEHPWGMAFHPDGSILVTEREGALRRFRDGSLSPPIAGVPEVAAVNQGGLLDIALHPDDPDRVFLSYSERRKIRRYATTVATAKLGEEALEDVTVIFRAQPEKSGGRHFGSRFLFTAEGDLLITVGDRADRPSAQDNAQHHGSVVRIRAGELTSAEARPEIYSYGHRNQQGMSHSCDGKHIWAHEHGPQGGDELNLVERGKNYGWPLITYGVNYVIGTKIGETHMEGMEQPVHKWVPSIGPSGMVCYNGSAFPEWRGNLLLGSLIYRQLVRLELDQDNNVVHEERMLDGAIGRVRDVRVGLDGHLYLLSDASNGKLVRLEPATP